VVASARRVAATGILILLAFVALTLLGLLLTFHAVPAVPFAGTNFGDLVMFGLAALVLGRHCNVLVAILDRRKILHALRIPRQLKLQLPIVVDLDAVRAINLIPLQGQSSAVILHDARVNAALAVDAGRAAVSCSRLASTAAHSRDRNTNSLLLDVADDNAVIAGGYLDDAIIIVRSAFAAIARFRAGGAR
jgi:uncharacterized membrane protein